MYDVTIRQQMINTIKGESIGPRSKEFAGKSFLLGALMTHETFLKKLGIFIFPVKRTELILCRGWGLTQW